MKSTLPPPMKATRSSKGHRGASILLWSLTIFLVLLFLAEGISKVLLDAGTIHTFHKFGYPVWFVFVVGLLEFSGAILISIPRLALLGATLLIVDMIGAIVTGIIQGIVPIILFSAFILLLIALVGWARLKRFVGWPVLQSFAPGATTGKTRLPETVGSGQQKERAND